MKKLSRILERGLLVSLSPLFMMQMYALLMKLPNKSAIILCIIAIFLHNPHLSLFCCSFEAIFFSLSIFLDTFLRRSILVFAILGELLFLSYARKILLRPRCNQCSYRKTGKYRTKCKNVRKTICCYIGFLRRRRKNWRIFSVTERVMSIIKTNVRIRSWYFVHKRCIM